MGIMFLEMCVPNSALVNQFSQLSLTFLQISVGVHQWSSHHSAANFASPDTFAPERWLPDAPERYHGDKRAALQPFSLGPRGCLGRG